MNFARQGPWVYQEDRDDRTDIEKLRDALEAHERSIEAHSSVSNDANASEELFGLIQARFDDTQATLFALIEDMTCVSAARLQRALSA